jgi:hypothetical protein
LLKYPFVGLAVFAGLSFANPVLSFTSPGSLSSGAFSLGWQFNVNSSITVDALAYFSDTGTLTESHEVGIYDSSGDLLTSTTVSAGTCTDYVNYFCYQSITPITLAVGTDYQVMGQSGLVDDWNWNTTGLSTIAAITFTVDEHTTGNSLAFGNASNGLTQAVGGGFFGASFDTSASSAPEPDSLLLVGGALIGLGVGFRSRLKSR